MNIHAARAEIDQLWADAQGWVRESHPSAVHAIADALEAESAEAAFGELTPEALEVVQGLARLALREVGLRMGDMTL